MILLDTSYLIALFDARDGLHARAVAWSEAVSEPLLVTEYVLWESYDQDFEQAGFGLIPIWQGKVFLEGEPVASPKPREWLRAGVSYVPQGNRVFTDLTVAENLEMGGSTLPIE